VPDLLLENLRGGRRVRRLIPPRVPAPERDTDRSEHLANGGRLNLQRH